MKQLLRLLALAGVCLFLFAAFPLIGSAAQTVGLGDFLYLGTDESGAPILWRCVAMREEGPLMVSDKVITFKAFDANTSGVSALPQDPDDAGEVRKCYGSNRWETSSLRQWLNSTGKIDWKHHVPTAEHVRGNAYADEAGFLSYFNSDELALVKSVTNKSAISAVDKPDDGSEVHVYSLEADLNSMLQNYDTAYAQYTEDRFFCLNTPEIIQMYNNLGNYYEVGYPTAAAKEQCDPQYMDNHDAVYYWLRDAVGDQKYPEGVRCMYPGAHEYYYNAHNGNIGVRPAFVLQDTSFSYGTGSFLNPFSLTEEVRTDSSLTVPEKSDTHSPDAYVGSAGVSKIAGENATIAIGDYIIMGELDDEPILWRCVDIDKNGPLLLSDKLLRFYSFDAMGDHVNDPDDLRAQFGSNRWSISALRHWLNSDLDSWGNWEGVAVPSASNLFAGLSPYDSAPGFLTAFSEEEQGMIKTVKLNSLLNILDEKEANSGSEIEKTRRKITLLNNYQDAYKETTTDKVFLLDRLQANKVYELFEDYILASPTVGAVAQSNYKAFAISQGKTWHYWLRDAIGSEEHPYYTMDITTDGRVSADLAYSAQYGVRPAFYLDMNALLLEKGSGTATEPYVVKAHEFGPEVRQIEPTCTYAGRAELTCVDCGYVKSYELPALEHDFQTVKERDETLFFQAYEHNKCSRCAEEYTLGGRAKPVLLIVAIPVLLAGIAVPVWLKKKRSK